MKLSLKFWRKRNNSRHELSVAQLELLRREDAEARRGAISPFSLNVGTDPSTKALGVGYTTSGPTPIIGTPLSFNSLSAFNLLTISEEFLLTFLVTSFFFLVILGLTISLFSIAPYQPFFAKISLISATLGFFLIL